MLTAGLDHAMTNSELQERHVGRKFTVRHCEGAIDSFAKAVSGVPKGQRDKYQRWMLLQIKRLADGERISNDSFPWEGELPGLAGRPKKKFRALKKIPVRGYCWKSERHENVYYISHYIHKKKNSLDSNDTTKVGNNWTRIEVDGNEY